MTANLAKLCSVAALLLLGSCASLFGPRDVEVPLSSLQAAIDRRFPMDRRLLEVFDIRVRSPRLALQPDTGRLVTLMDAEISPPFSRNNPWRGNMSLSGLLSIDPLRQSIILTQPRVEGLHIDGLAPDFARQATRVGTLLAEQLFRDLPLYTFNSGDYRYAGVNFIPIKINTKGQSVVVTFEPAK